MRMLQRQLSMAFLKWRDAAAELKKCAGLGGVRNDTWPRRRSSNDDVSPASIASVRTYIGKIRHSDTHLGCQNTSNNCFKHTASNPQPLCTNALLAIGVQQPTHPQSLLSTTEPLPPP